MVKFVKMHGLGNDFVIIDGRNIDLHYDASNIWKIADRRYGVGCDQLIIIENSKIADCKMTIFNQDGSSSGACGNATRCVTKLLKLEHGTIEVGDRILSFYVNGNNYEINMGRANFDWKTIPLLNDIDPMSISFQDHECFENDDLKIGHAVQIGNPHLVFFLHDFTALSISQVGHYFEHHHMFPEMANVNFAQIVHPQLINLKVWERGAGMTLACGSGACATVAVGHRKGLLSNSCTVRLPGGELCIRIEDNGDIHMTGPATEVFTGYFNL
ncbi:diaminopimelate epimerase [Rickettsiales endosymbiont of Peranema trichophorum]|uniref:diaminopimelate epimerase n=1 Tax=Rickettsiales endosymbiont of Peranema trichophorum TaxID=2486577 RepID=UPI001022FF18|nr:diaminopimelate epimerase [Rickettsiales endosymbiont of Peranema trichophorum]RZI47209.1 diaminopimelate epimerase [Rickettsiales endosymbiont of Peranema trichophorum]